MKSTVFFLSSLFMVAIARGEPIEAYDLPSEKNISKKCAGVCLCDIGKSVSAISTVSEADATAKLNVECGSLSTCLGPSSCDCKSCRVANVHCEKFSWATDCSYRSVPVSIYKCSGTCSGSNAVKCCVGEVSEITSGR